MPTEKELGEDYEPYQWRKQIICRNASRLEEIRRQQEARNGRQEKLHEDIIIIGGTSIGILVGAALLFYCVIKHLITLPFQKVDSEPTDWQKLKDLGIRADSEFENPPHGI